VQGSSFATLMAGVSVSRRSQRERRVEMRERILNAAVLCLVELGYGETTTLAVQARAGVSRGALLHYFPTRTDLVVEAVDHLFDSVKADMRAQVRADVAEADRIAAAVDSLWESFRGPLFAAALELWMAARTDPDLLVALVPHERRLGHEIKVLCGELFGPVAGTHPRFGEVCELLVQAMRGAALSSVVTTRPQREREFVAMLKKTASVLLVEGA
jgi:AcrR family transcriptional regulator